MQADDFMLNKMVHHCAFGSFILEYDHCFHASQNDPHQVEKQTQIHFWLPKHAEPI